MDNLIGTAVVFTEWDDAGKLVTILGRVEAEINEPDDVRPSLAVRELNGTLWTPYYNDCRPLTDQLLTRYISAIAAFAAVSGKSTDTPPYTERTYALEGSDTVVTCCSHTDSIMISALDAGLHVYHVPGRAIKFQEGSAFEIAELFVNLLGKTAS